MPRIRRTGGAKSPDATDAVVGHNIRILRNLKGLTQAALAERLGVTFQQVQKYERGVNRVGSGRLYAIAGVFDVPVSRFYEGAKGARSGANGLSALALIAGREPLRLVQAFAKVKNRRLRRAIIAIVEHAVPNSLA